MPRDVGGTRSDRRGGADDLRHRSRRASGPPPGGWPERLLRPFADVQAGEAPQLLLLALNVFLLLAAYYVMKPVREALILAQPRGAEIKSYAIAASSA